MRMGEQGQDSGGELPRDVRGRVALVRQVIQSCLPGELTVDLPGLGELVLRPVVSEHDADWLLMRRHSCEVVLIEAAGREALLLVERGFALHAVNTLLGQSSVSAACPLSRIERGVLHGVLALLYAHLGSVLTINACSEDRQAPNPDSVVIEFSSWLHGSTGHAWLCASVEFLAQIQATRTTTSKASLAAVRLELARTSVPISQLTGAKEGDVVVFDETAAPSDADPWPVRIRIGDTAISASLRPNGVLTSEPGDDLGNVTRTERRSPAKYGAVPPDASAEIVADLGHFQGSSLVALLCGAPVAGGRGDPLLLRLADAPWAEGQITACGDVLAVRITRKPVG
jgi:hypothetical protein